MFIEATDTQPGNRADLVSTLLASGHTYCMEIALSMYGNTMGDINVYTKVCNKTCLYLFTSFYILIGFSGYHANTHNPIFICKAGFTELFLIITLLLAGKIHLNKTNLTITQNLLTIKQKFEQYYIFHLKILIPWAC